MILTNNSIPQFQNGLKGNTIPDTELKYFAKARFIHFTAAHVFDIVYLQSQDRIHGNTAARAVSTCIWSRCVPDRIAVCGSDTQGRRTRTPTRGRKLYIRNRTRLSTKEKVEKERERDRSGWIKRRAEIVARLWYLKSISGSCHEPWTHNRRPRRSSIFFLPALHRPASILTVVPISRAKPDDTFQKCQPRN